MRNNPLVSLITPGWNGVGFVHRLLDSILAQTYTDIEYIYVDDGSTDGTKDIVLSYEERFKQKGMSFIFISQENGGVSSAVNEGLKHVTGKYFGWPEYDDFLTPDSIEMRVKYLEEHADCAVVTSDAWLINEDNIEQPYGVLSHNNPNRFDRNHFVQALLSNSVFTAACHLVRTDAFDKTHPGRTIFPSRMGPNWQMLLPMLYHYSRGFIEKPLVYYLVRKDSISHSHETLDKRIAAVNEFQNILYTVLDAIEMHPDDRALYKRLVAEYYAKYWCELGAAHRNEEIFYKGYDYLTSHNVDIPPRIADMHHKIFEVKKKRFKLRFLKFWKKK